MHPESDDIAEALRLIRRRSSYERGYISNPFAESSNPTLGLQRTRALLDALDAPDLAYPIVHVAGSKGKGSTSSFIAAIGGEAGYRTGLYTSPHLHSFRERIAIDREPIGERNFAELTRSVSNAIKTLESNQPELGPVTAFEMLTAMGMLAFANEGCQLAVVEVGLGGTYDATNVVHPAVSVITRLDLEHTQVLGDTLASIAANKAGIIKPGIPVVSAPQEPEPLAVIARRAHLLHAPWLLAGRDFRSTGYWRAFSWAGATRTIPNLQTGMAGPHQLENATLAVAAWQQLAPAGLLAGDDAVRNGLLATALPGRFEQVTARHRRWVLDGAHTPLAASALAETLLAETGRPVTVVAGFLRDKHPSSFLAALAPAIARLIVTTPDHPRGWPAAELLTTARTVDALAIDGQNLDASLRLARSLTGPDKPILVTGSLTLVAEARAQLGLANPDSAAF